MKKFYILLNILGLCFILVAGIWFGMRWQYSQTMKESAYEEKHGTDIAVVNQDLGVSGNDQTINYANAVIETLGNDYTVVSLSAAEAGLENGTYGAVVTFPADFSENILSINQTNPEQAVLDLAVSKKLPEDSYISIYTQLIGMQQQVNSNIAYAYVESVFEELHLAQDDVEELLANDETDMRAVEKVRLTEYTEMLDLGDIPKVEFNPDSPDFEALLKRVQDIADEMNGVYVDSYAIAQEDFTEVKKKISDYEDAITSQSALWTANMNSWAQGVVSYVGELSKYKQDLEDWREEAENYREKEKTYADAVSSYKTAIDEYFSTESTNLGASRDSLQKWREGANTRITGIGDEIDTASNDINDKVTKCQNLLSGYNTEIEKLEAWIDYITDYQEYIEDPDTYQNPPELPKVDKPVKQDATDALEELSSFSTDMDKIFDSLRGKVEEIPEVPEAYSIESFTEQISEKQPDLIDEVPPAPDYSLPWSVPTQPQEMTDALMGIVSVSAGYNPDAYFDDKTKEKAQQSVSKYASHLESEKGEMESTNSSNLQQLNSAHQTYNQHVGELRMNITEVHSKEQEKLLKSITELSDTLKNTSKLNHGLMDSFVARMPSSRISSTVNQEVVEATVTPVTYAYNYIRGRETGEQRNLNIWLLPLLILIAIAMLLVSLLMWRKKRKLRGQNIET